MVPPEPGGGRAQCGRRKICPDWGGSCQASFELRVLAVAVVDAFHIVKLGTAGVDEVRRRVQQQIYGHRGRKTDPLYRIRNILRAGQEHLTDRQKTRLETEKVLASFPTCPIPEIARLGRTLNQWQDAFPRYFTTSGANNGGTEAINGLIELARRVARSFRNPDNYRLRMLLIGGGLRL